ncbi:MAG: chromate transporter [Spirochaetales bacterium]|nr:chromate transporter [Candidatus Physcosoma equi]
MLSKLFLAFLQVGLFSIGGGYAAIPIIQSSVVDGYGWLTMSEFTDLITIAEMTPGPIAVNSATFVGNRVCGLMGSIVATLGCITPALVIVSLFAWIYYRYKTVTFMKTIMNFLRPVVVALIASSGISILRSAVLPASGFDILGSVLVLGAFVIIRRTKTNPIFVMFSSGIIYALVHLIF